MIAQENEAQLRLLRADHSREPCPANMKIMAKIPSYNPLIPPKEHTNILPMTMVRTFHLMFQKIIEYDRFRTSSINEHINLHISDGSF
jgi:hypothetical protein